MLTKTVSQNVPRHTTWLSSAVKWARIQHNEKNATWWIFHHFILLRLWIITFLCLALCATEPGNLIDFVPSGFQSFAVEFTSSSSVTSQIMRFLKAAPIFIFTLRWGYYCIWLWSGMSPCVARRKFFQTFRLFLTSMIFNGSLDHTSRLGPLDGEISLSMSFSLLLFRCFCRYFYDIVTWYLVYSDVNFLRQL